MISYHLFDTLLEPVFIVNADKGIVYANETAGVISSQNLRRLIKSQTPFDQIFTFSEPLDFLNHLKDITDPTPYKELNFTNISGEQGKVQITAQKVYFQSEADHWIIFFRDVTLEERLQKKYKAELESKETYILELQKAKQELENYSQNLEKMVQERTAELSRLNQTLSALLNSLGQGFFVFDEQGLCQDVYSKACLDLLEKEPPGKKIWEILALPENKIDGFQKWMTTAFAEMLPFEDLTPLAPNEFKHSQNRNIQLEYFPLRNEEQAIQAVVVMATDRTDLVAAQKQAEVEKNKVQQVLKILHNKNQISLFIKETSSQLQQLQSFKASKTADLDVLKRILHTLKGNASLYNIQDLSERAHHFESALTEKNQWNPKDWISTIDDLSLDFSKFLLLKEELLPSSQKTDFDLEGFFNGFDSEIQRIALLLGKDVQPLEVLGAKTVRLDEEVYGSLLTSLIHFFRNSVDHGLELPDVRKAKGKDPAGKISVQFEQASKDRVSIQISDDGAGLNFERLKKKAAEKGLPGDKMTQQELAMMIFEPSFSTKDQVTEISGRGVGLDAVKEQVEQLKGQIQVHSVPNQGTKFVLNLPFYENKRGNRTDPKVA